MANLNDGIDGLLVIVLGNKFHCLFSLYSYLLINSATLISLFI